MAQNVVNRIWNWLVNRYDQDSEADCCGPAIEEVTSDSETDEQTDESKSCCE